MARAAYRSVGRTTAEIDDDENMRTLLGALLVLALPLAGRAAQPVLSADLDTKEGHFSTWVAEGLERTSGCSVVAEMVAAYEDKRWGSSMTFSVQGAAEDARVSLRLWRPKGKDVLNARLILGNKPVEQTDLKFVGPLHKPLAVTISWRSGTMEFKIDDEIVAAVERRFEVTGVTFAASTANVKLGSIAFQQRSE